MAKFKPYRAEQLLLFPQCIKDYVPENHLARLVDKVVEQLDTDGIEGKYSELVKNWGLPSKLETNSLLIKF